MFSIEELKMMRHLVIKDNTCFKNRHAGSDDKYIKEVMNNREEIVTKLDVAIEEGFKMNVDRIIEWLNSEKYIMDNSVISNDSDGEIIHKNSRNRMIDKTIKMITEEYK